MIECTVCGRGTRRVVSPGRSHGKLVRGWVTHESYGCDTGCCGTIVRAEDANGIRCATEFDFGHSGDTETEARVEVEEAFPGVTFDLEASEIGCTW